MTVNNKKKIGFQLNFFDFRNDMRMVINIISQSHEVVLFVRKVDIDAIKPHITKDIEIRFIDEKVNSIKNKLWRNLFSKFGKIPKSFRNHYLAERYLIYLIKNKYLRWKALLSFDFFIKLPKWISYDSYLYNLDYSGATYIEDIDKFICLTRISDDYFFSRLLKEQKDIQVYVYSWDHPCKHKQFSKSVKYLVWNDGIKNDLNELQKIPRQNISTIGSSQFCYIKQFFSKDLISKISPYNYDYIYFGCSTGIPVLAKQEIKIIKKLSDIIKKTRPDLKMVIRLYPVLENWSYYDELKELKNIELDDSYRTTDLSVSENSIMEKFLKIHHAKAFLHLGTTLGLEACFTSTPSFLIDFGYDKKKFNILNIKNSIHQYQNEKYLFKKARENILKSEKSLIHVLKNIESKLYIENNTYVTKDFELISFKALSKRLINA